MVLAGEVPAEGAFNSALVKRWTGGDEIEAMAKYKNPFTFRPRGTLWLSGNAPPGIAYHENAMWRRLVLIPFEHAVPRDEQDRRLPERLKRPGAMRSILASAVEGWRDLVGRGGDISPPDTISQQIAGLRDDLLALEALLGYDIDFPEEDDGPIAADRIDAATVAVRERLGRLLATAAEGMRLRAGALVKVVVVKEDADHNMFANMVVHGLVSVGAGPKHRRGKI